jgi:hypothetical protein
MNRTYGSMLRVVGLAFALVVGVHFAAPPSAAASCFCSGPAHNTPTFQEVGDSCDAAMGQFGGDFLQSESDTCGTFDACSKTTFITTACFQRTDGLWEIDGHERFDCQSGTTCP